MQHKLFSCQEADVFNSFLISNWILYVSHKKGISRVCGLKCYHHSLPQGRIFEIKISCPKMCLVSQPLPCQTQQFPLTLAFLWVLMFTNLQLSKTSHGNQVGKLPKCKRYLKIYNCQLSPGSAYNRHWHIILMASK